MRRLALVIFLLAAAASAYAQSNAFIDRVLAGKGLTGGEAAYLALVASGNIGDDADEARSFELLGQLKWVPGDLSKDRPITHAEYAYILMRAFGIKGGLLYSLFPSPRYAYRELCYLVVIQGATDPAMPVSGSEAMRIIGRVFDVKGVKQ